MVPLPAIQFPHIKSKGAMTGGSLFAIAVAEAEAVTAPVRSTLRFRVQSGLMLKTQGR